MAVKGKIILRGRIKNLSPLHIGCGSGDRSDLDVLRNGDGNPFIPATSFVGVLKHAIESSDDSEYRQFSEYANKFWGFSKNDDGHQSTFRCSDLTCQSDSAKTCQSESPKIVIRDGIKIDSKTGLVEDKKKYDYEIVDREAVFNLRMEFSYKNDDKKFVKRMIATICLLLKNEKIQIGSKTNSGLGTIILEDEKLYEFDFSPQRKTDVYYWLTLNQNLPEKNRIELKSLGNPFQIKGKYFTIDATFQLKNSLIIRSYSDDPEMPDAVHLKSLNDFVLTGTSLKGAIRARSERIVNTLGKSDSIVKRLFGNVDDEKRSKDAKKGKIQVKESILPKFVSEMQTRIKIDRFTGGTIESALFDTMPLFSSDGKGKVINISICVRDYEDYEAGLLLLVLKDLWTGDLAVGGEKNIGRGVFEGVNAFIRFDSDEIFIDKDVSGISPETANKLQYYVKKLEEK